MTDTWVTPRVWVAFERVSAAKMNEISNDLRVLFPYGAAGDIAYAVNSDSLGALAKPGGLGILSNNASGMLSWVTGGSALQGLRKNAANNGYEWVDGYECCVVRRASNFTHSTGTITWDTELYDTGNWHSTSSNTSRITVPTAGVYKVGGILVTQMPSSGSVDWHQMTFHKNGSGSSLYRLDITVREDNAEKTLYFETPPLTLSANDYFEMQASFDNGSKTRTIDASRSAFWIERLRGL
jgi:hypothetical protein